MPKNELELQHSLANLRKQLVQKLCMKGLRACVLAEKKKKGGCYMSSVDGCYIVELAITQHHAQNNMGAIMPAYYVSRRKLNGDK